MGCKYTAYFHGVNRYRTNLLIAAMIMVFVGLVVLQFSWVRSTIITRDQIFTKSVGSVLQSMEAVFARANFTLPHASGSASPDDPLAALPATGAAATVHRDSLRNAPPVISRMAKMQVIDSMLTIAFATQGVEGVYRTAVFDRFGRPIFVREADDPSISEFLNQGFHIHLGQNVKPDDLQILYVWFPHQTFDRVAGLWLQLVLTVLLMAVMVFLTLYTATGLRKAQRLNKLKADLINNMTHELKTPISTIGLAAEALSDHSIASHQDDRQYYLRMIRDENRRLTVLVENVLNAAALDQGVLQLVLEPINMHDLLSEVVKKQAISIHKRGGRVQQKFSAEQPIIEGDHTHWTNVVFNLVDNAMKYGGDKPILLLETWNDGNRLHVSFKDNGVGISKEHLSKIFDKLFRVPTGLLHDVKGFGIGLSYVKSVVEQHGASIDVTSKLGVGSTFVLTVPLKNLKPTKHE